MNEIDRPYALSGERVAGYREDGFVKLEQVLRPELLTSYEGDVTRAVRDWSPGRLFSDYGPEILEIARKSVTPSGGSDTYARAFTQRPNLWRQSPRVAEFVRGRRLARLAAELMGVEGVRLYHDQALYKEPGGGHTPFHCDQFYWPLSNPNTITAWIPLQPVPMEMGPVAFARGSHRCTEGGLRDLAISDESEARITELMADFEIDNSPFDLGDVSFHSGWTCHRADENQTERVRAAFTIIYMDRDMRLLEPRTKAHRVDASFWLPGIEPGEVAASKLNPILYERESTGPPKGSTNP